MNILQESINWLKGEIFEATIFGSFGIILILLALISYKIGETPNTKAVVIPILVVGFIFSCTGFSGMYTNRKKIEIFEQSYQQNPESFLSKEKKRVEDFQYLYTITKIIAAVCFSIAISIFFFSKNSLFHSIAIALIILGLTGLIIDYFSKERADLYYQTILNMANNV